LRFRLDDIGVHLDIACEEIYQHKYPNKEAFQLDALARTNLVEGSISAALFSKQKTTHMTNSFLVYIAGLSISALILLWIYFFIYSYRHKDSFPWGFSIEFIGLLLNGARYQVYDNQVVIFSIGFSLLVSLIGILLNVNNIQNQFVIRDRDEFLRFTGRGLASGLLFGFFFILAQGTKDFQIDLRYALTAYIATSIQAGIAEELQFRGYLFGYLRKYEFSPIFSVVFPALIFAILHIPRYPGNWVVIFIAFLAGLTAGYLTWKSNNLISALVLHVTFNLLIVVWWLTIG
jgi:membrane protease YdiL (CAAX protease family)